MGVQVLAFSRRRLVVALGLASVGVAMCVPAAPAHGGGVGEDDSALREVLAGFDKVQASIRTLSADFTKTTVNQLLKDPLIAKGHFYLTKPNSVRWEFTAPEVMKFVIANDEYIGYFPEQKRAEKHDVHRWSERIFRGFGLGQSSADLAKFYEIRMAQPDAEAKGTHLLLLRPKKRRVRKQVEEVRFWVSASTYLPVKIEYSGKDGSTRVTWHFRDVQVNPDLSAALYKVDIPSDIPVTTGFSGLGSVRPDGGAAPPGE